MRTQTVIKGDFAAKLNAVVTPMRRAAIEAVPAHIRCNPHLDPETGLPRHVQAHLERGEHLKDPVFHVRSWLLRRDCVNAYNLLTDDEIRHSLKRHGGYIRGTVRTLAATWDDVVI